MKSNPRVLAAAFVAASVCLTSARVAHAQYDAPATYYSTATGTGAALKSQLNTIVTTGNVGVNYGDARFSATYTDPGPSAGTITLIYNRAVISDDWDNGVTWNREHIWPQSHLGVGDPNNTTINIATDQHNLRPSNPGINSTRGNSPYGIDSTTGGHGTIGSYYYPGNADAGDVARTFFYMATRWSQLSLTDGTPAGLQMGDLSSLIRWNYRDVPDAFERRRNHAIYGLAGENSPAITNPHRQQNRNPYVDHPEWVWSVFMNQTNDTQLSVGTTDANGGSSANVNLGRVLVNAAVPSAQNVTLNKTGANYTYYSVTPGGLATSSVTGRLNTFGAESGNSRSLSVGLNTTTTVAGPRTGSVSIDNLDITTAGGAGHGGNDANDTINVSLDVLAHANGSFAAANAADQNTLNLNFGAIGRDTGVHTLPFSISNLLATAGYTSLLEFDGISGSGSTGVLSADLSSFGAGLAEGATANFLASLDSSALGNYAATYTINLSDENLAGALSNTLTLNLFGLVTLPKGTWLGGSGTWSDAAKWGESLVPNDSSFNIKLDDGNTSTASVATLDQNSIVGTITQDAGDTLTINATRTLTIAGTSASNLAGTVNNNGGITLQAGATTLSGGGTHAGSFNVASDAILTFAGGAHTLAPGSGTLPGAGLVRLSAGSITVGGNLHIAGTTSGGGFEQTGGTLDTTGLVVGSASTAGAFSSTGGTLNVAAIEINNASQVIWANAATLVTNTLTTAGTGRLDLTNSAMVLKSSSLPAVGDMIAQAYNGGDWQGGGITSSTAASDPNFVTAIGYASNADAFYTEFQGVTGLDSDDVLVRVTSLGDSDLNGDTNLDDFPLFTAGLEDDAAGGPDVLSDGWFYGDYDYNGVTNLDDFPLFTYGLENDAIQLAAFAELIEMSSLSASDKTTMLNIVAAVPEPATFALFSAAACGGLMRRRRK